MLKGLREMISAQHAANAGFRRASESFLTHAQEAINPALGEADVREMLIQHKERKPKDPTLREKFDAYRFAEHKERVIDLLAHVARVARVRVKTLRLVEALKGGPR